MSQVYKNTFTGSMNLDAVPWMTSQGSWEYALNAINKSRDSKYFGLVNEEFNQLCAEVNGRIVGATFIDERNQTLLFTDTDELWLLSNDTCKTKFVCSAREFGCTWNLGSCEYHYAELKPMGACNELHAYFSSKCYYYVINLDEMSDSKRKNAIKSSFKDVDSSSNCEYSCDYFKLFKCVCTPKISPTVSEHGGYGLVSGAYQFAVQLEDSDGNTTNWSWITNPVSLGSLNNIGGEDSRGSINLNISCLDCRYDKVNIAVVRTINGAQAVEVFSGKHYNGKGIDFRYYGQKGRVTNLDEITIKRKTFLRGKDMIQEDGRLWLYNIKNEKNLHYQPKAWKAQVDLVEYEVTSEQQKKYQYKSLMRGERYLPGIVWKYCDNTYSNVFLLSPTGGGSAGNGSFGGNTLGRRSSSSSTSTDDNADTANIVSVNNAGDEGNITSQTFTSPEYNSKRGNPEGESNFVKNNVDNISTNVDNFVNSTKCSDCQGEDCEGCNEDSVSATNDMPNIESTSNNWVDELTGLSNDEASKPSSTSLRDSASNLLSTGVDQAERIEQKKGFLRGGTQSNASPTGDKESSYSSSDGSEVPGSTRGHQTTDCNGTNLTEEEPREVSSRSFIPFLTSNNYPDTKDCQGNPLWGDKAGTPVELFEVPGADKLPVVVSYNDGVASTYTPDNDELGNTYVRLLGIRVKNIQFPTEDELPKPLCPSQPYKIVMVPRDHINRHVVAKGMVTSTFLGGVRGATYAFPRHGVNSFETIDRFVDENGSRVATGGDGPGYNFHSLDTEIGQPTLAIDSVLPERYIYGNGWRHGMYAEGEKPIDDLNGTRVDQRGTRQSINLNKSRPRVTNEIPVNGITYADADKLVTPPSGITYALMNRFRESSVYFEPSSKLPDLVYNGGKGQADNSFVADGLIHSAPINESCAWYVSLRRDIPDQYGSVESMRFVDTGISATSKGGSIVSGICGDVFIGPHTFRRTGYVSNKVGNTHETSKGPKTICQTPDDLIFQQNGQWFPTKLPKSGDKRDPKNFANAHPDKDPSEASQSAAPETDFYYPRVQKTLVIYWGEFEVNPYLRATGEFEGQVYYPNLKELDLDSDAPTSSPWENSWLNRFYCRVEQPSRQALLKKTLLRSFLDLIAPVGGMSAVLSLESVQDTTGFFYMAPMALAVWWFANRVLFKEDKINELLGIPTCKIDDEGAEYEDSITQFENNYYDYNWDHSKINEENIYLSMPSNYNTCDCDDCSDDQTSNEVYYSNKQVLGSDVDSYTNFKSNSYTEIPTHAGQLKKMFKYNGRFYAHTTEGLHLVSYKLGQIGSSIGDLLLGGELLVNPVQILEGVKEGFAGIQDPNSSIVTKFGYVFIDREARKIYNFDGKMPKEISMQGMELWFKEHLPFCGESNCQDEKSKDGIYYSMGWDPRYDRLLVTKKDLNSNDSWTLSYDPMTNEGKGGWISFHSYIPTDYVWDRHDLYSIKDGGVYKHNVKGSYQTYYGEYKPYMVQFSAIDIGQGNSMKPFMFQDLTLRTEAEESAGCDYIRDLDKTFNKLAVWNHTQGTGTLYLDTIGDNWGGDEDQYKKLLDRGQIIKIQKSDREWSLNEIQDYRKEDCKDQPMITCDSDCQAIPDINEVIYDCSAATQNNNYTNKRLKDDHITYRLTKDDGQNETRLKLVYLETNKPGQ